MTQFNHLNAKTVKKSIAQFLQFYRTIPLTPDFPNKTNMVLNYIHKFLSIIFYHDIIDPKLDIKVGMRSSEGKEEKLDLFQNSHMFFHNLLKQLSEEISITGIENYIAISNNFIKIRGIELLHKIGVINTENNFLKDKLENFVQESESIVANEFLEIRLQIVLSIIYSEDKIIIDNEVYDNKEEALYNLFNLYLSYMIDGYIFKNKVFQAYNYLQELLNKDDDRIRKIIIQRLVNLNSRFLLEPISKLTELIDENEDLFNEHELMVIRSENENNPIGTQISSMVFGGGKISQKIIEETQITTLIRFSIPFSTLGDEIGIIKFSDTNHFEYKEIENYYEDPIFKICKNFSLGGIGMNYFSDVFNSINNRSLFITFVIKGFYNPALELTDDDYKEVRFSDESALYGRDYYPHKEFVIKQLRDNIDKLKPKININKHDLNINLFSNYIVQHLDDKTRKILYYRVYTLTNPDSFKRALERYQDRLSEINLTDSYISIRDLFNRTSLTTSRNLSLFIQSLINIVIKNIVRCMLKFLS